MNMRTRRGFTIIELIVAMLIGTVLLLGIGHILVHMFVSMGDSVDFGNATGRVDVIRQLTFDARTGEALIFPVTDGAGGAYTSGSNSGQQVRFRSVSFDPVTQTSTRVFVAWESRRASTASATDPFYVYRMAQVDTNTDLIENDGGYSLSFAEGPLTAFDVQRVSRNNFTVEMKSTSNKEDAHVLLSVTLRNVR